MSSNIWKHVQSATEKVAHFFREYPRLKTAVATFSLHSIQLFVGDVEDRSRQLHKGVSFQMPRQGWPINRAAILSPTDAIAFEVFLSRLEAVELPSSFAFSKRLDDLKWEVREYKKDWHGGGGFVGYLHGNWLADHSNPPRVIITKSAVSELRATIEEHFSIAT